MERKPIIDLVRTFSVFSVVGYHWLLWSGISPQAHALPAFLFSSGNYGVSIFFVVSGYLITGLIDNRRQKIGVREFYVRRAARILPLFLLIVYWGWINFHFAHDNPGESPLSGAVFRDWSLSYDFWFWASLFTFLFNWTIALRGPHWGLQWVILWSLAVEEQFYLSYPWALKSLKKNERILIFLAAVVVIGWGFTVFFTYFDHGRFLGMAGTNSFSSFGQIALGALLYFLSNRWQKSLSRKTLSGFLCVLGFGLSFWAYAIFKTFAGPSLVALGCFLFLLGGLGLDFFKGKTWNHLTFPGKLSYGCYLWHPTVLFFLAPWIIKMNFWSSFLILMTATLSLAWVSEAFFERPANQLIRRLLKAGPKINTT